MEIGGSETGEGSGRKAGHPLDSNLERKLEPRGAKTSGVTGIPLSFQAWSRAPDRAETPPPPTTPARGTELVGAKINPDGTIDTSHALSWTPTKPQ
jgi:hypothetical protein